MKVTIKELTLQALSLPPKSRAILADTLLDSLEEVKVENLEKFWITEAKKRSSEIKDGKVQCKPHKQVMNEALKSIQ